MSQPDGPPPGPDFRQGVALSELPADAPLAGHVAGEAALLVRTAEGLRIVGAHCTHYGAPLAEGLVEGDTIHCPWHHACFDLRTGAATCAPAFAPLPAWQVEEKDGIVYARARTPFSPPVGRRCPEGADEGQRTPFSPPAGRRCPEGADEGRFSVDHPPHKILIIGGGAAGYAAAHRLRELGYDGALTMASADPDLPCDRPNLSKDYLAGTAPEEWIPLQDAQAFRDQGIDLRLGCEVLSIDPATRRARTRAGELDYDALLLATGAEPRRLPLPGFDSENVFVLRSLADARAIIAAAQDAREVAFIGAGFIGMEAAAALRTRGLAVSVVAPEAIPMERVLGPQLGNVIAALHRNQGVALHLGRKPARLDGRDLHLDDGTRVGADLVVVGAGVVPRTQLAEAAGLAVDNGILVDERLQASLPGHFAAGDVARYPHAGGRARVEHWVHAERMGQRAAENMLGAGKAFDDVPFFWTHQYDLELRVSGHLSDWDAVEVEGDLAGGDFIARYRRDGRLVAAAAAGRDGELLRLEQEALRVP